MKKYRVFDYLNNTLIICAASLFMMTSGSSSLKAQNMNETSISTEQEVGMKEVEKNRIFVTMHATFKDEEQCRVAMETIVSDAHAAYGVNSHFWFRSEDGKSLFVFEQYEDKKALRKAIRRFTSARMSFFRSIKVEEVAVYGGISASSKLMFSLLRPKYMEYYGGYSKNVAITQEAGIKDFERNRIYVVTNATIRDEEKCKVAVEELIEEAYAKSGTNSQFLCKSKDGEALFVLEQYADEKSLIDHLMANPTSRTAFFESIEVGDVTVYGNVSDKVKVMFASHNPIYMNYYGGYSK